MLKGIKQPNLTAGTTRLPGTELPTVQHSSDITGNKDVGNVIKNMNTSLKNPLMGQRAVFTNTKNHLANQTKSSLPSIKTGFEPVKLQESQGNIMNLRKALILETTILRNKIDHGVENGMKIHSGSKDSAVPHGKLAELRDYDKPRKPLKNETLGIQNMPQKKKNQGLMFNSKMNTIQRNS